MNHSHDHSIGAAAGGIIGFAKSLTLISIITVQVVFETALLSAVGALVGFLVTSLLKFIKNKIKSL